MSYDDFVFFLYLLPLVLQSEHDPVATSAADCFPNRNTVKASLSFNPAVICVSSFVISVQISSY